jgi:hypothetical protein
MPVTITRTAWIDDDGSGTTGTVINNAEKTLLYNQIDEGFAALDLSATQGIPIAVPFNASDYSALTPMVWTVAAGNVESHHYSLVGKELTWAVIIVNSATSGTSTQQLTIRLPAGLTNSKQVYGPVTYLQMGGTTIPAQTAIAAGDTTVKIQALTFQALPLGTTFLYFTTHLWVI